MKTAIYGGSFNPPHLGHVRAAAAVMEKLGPDRLLIIPTNIPPHKEMAQGSPSPEQRMELCRLAFGDIPGAELSDMEIKREGRSYSADTVGSLREMYPQDELYLVMGSDMFLSFCQWYKFQYLLDNCVLTVLSREEDDREELESFKAELEEKYSAKVLLLSHEPLPMCSEEVRERLRLGLGSEMLPEAVYAEIIRRRYYEAEPELTWLRRQVIPLLSSQRIAHTAGCEHEAVQLAKLWGEDPEKAAVAGILHDSTKNLSYDEQLILCDKYGIILDNAQRENPKLLHAITGAALAKDRFGVSEEISQAIRWHTTGKPDMNTLEKIIYLADYIEPTRDFEGVERLRELAYEDLDAALA
ncbi:MAG TPA: nicotinate (nicotinamide) nucleotide adenylyltransferase, partial [Candidatus Limivicinus faecipullorum]|nr:nicotinate (nicotinamide) nucleotide adenylyltransferase [Candidatus Limivicinus faecipullorum]